MSSSSTSGQLAFRFRMTHALPFAVGPRVKADPARLVGALLRRMPKRNAARFAMTPEGRRAHRVIEELVMKLCG